MLDRAPRGRRRASPAALPFTWLNHVRRGVTHAEIGRGVLTGRMIGCYIFTYAFRGRPEVAHIGTVDWET